MLSWEKTAGEGLQIWAFPTHSWYRWAWLIWFDFVANLGETWFPIDRKFEWSDWVPEGLCWPARPQFRQSVANVIHCLFLWLHLCPFLDLLAALLVGKFCSFITLTLVRAVILTILRPWAFIVYYTMFLGSKCNFRNVALAPVFVFFLSTQQNWPSTVVASNSRSGVESTILECFANVNLSFFLFQLIELRIGASWCFNCVMSMVL